MKRRFLSILACLLALVLVAAACGSGGNGAAGTGGGGSAGGGASGGASGGGKDDQVTIRIFNFKVEIVEQLAGLIKEYEKEHPNVKINVETVGGGADYSATLKAKFNSGDIPDIFFNGGFSELDLWIEHLEDMTDEPWVEHLVDAAKPPMTKDGRIYGMPVNLEGYGFLYNKDLFAQAGITETPKTLDELRSAAQKLKDAGIQPFVNGYAEWWVLGNHLANIGFARQPDPEGFIKGLYDGTAKIPGNDVFNQWVDLIDLTLEFGNANPLQTDYNTQVTEFAIGNAAMTQQGNWTQVAVLQTNPDLKHGFLPMPINNNAEEMDKLAVGVPSNWVVYNKSPVKEEAKAFLNWMVSSEVGQRYIVEEFKFIPAFKNISADEAVLGPMAADIIRYSQAGKTIPWTWFMFPNGEATSNKFSDIMQAYIGGQIDRAQLLESMQRAWEEMSR
jgi:raffinose/stachyose/melibiose transport system substrate-binding protein